MGKYFRKRREELSYSIRQLAKETGLAKGTIDNIESNKRKLRRSTFNQLNKVLKLEFTYDQYCEYIKEGKTPEEDIALSDNIKNKLSKADDFYEEGKYEDALDIYLSLSKIFDKDGDYLYRCVILYNLLKEYEKSIEHCDKLLENENYVFDALKLKGECLGALGKNKEALEVFKKAIAINEVGEVYYNMGVSCLMDRNWQEAINYFEKCIEILPDFVLAYSNMALCYCRQFKAEEGMIYAQKAIELDPNMHEPYALMGSCLKELGRHEEAIVYYKKSLERDENNYEALCNIFISLAIAGQNKEAGFYYKKFMYLTNSIEKAKKFKRNQGFVGYTHLKDDTGSLDYPTLGKIYVDKEEFLKDIEEIKKSVSIIKYHNNPIYFTDDYVKVNVVALEKSTLLEVTIGNFSILDVDAWGDNLETFMKLYEKYKQFRIQLEYENELFVMECLKNISFKL